MEENKETKEVAQEAQQKEDIHSQLLNEFKNLRKEINDIKRNKFDASDIHDVVNKSLLSRQQEEEQFIESQRIEKLNVKHKTDLQIRNAIWDAALEKFVNGDVPPSAFRNCNLTGEKGSNDFTQMLSLCLYKFLAPSFGVSEQVLNSSSLIQSEIDFNNQNKTYNLIRNFAR